MRRHACSLDLDTVGYIHSRPARASSASHFPETLESERQLVYHIRASTTLLILTHAHTHTYTHHTDTRMSTHRLAGRVKGCPFRDSRECSGSRFHCSVLGVRASKPESLWKPLPSGEGCAGAGPAGLQQLLCWLSS